MFKPVIYYLRMNVLYIGTTAKMIRGLDYLIK
jgi:hypothetical protein